MLQAKPRKTPFEEFCDVQEKLNFFLWPAEIAICLVQQKILTGELRANRLPVFRLFPEIECNAFKAPANGRYEAKYSGSAARLNSDLDSGLGFFCKLVIVRFHRALERYIQKRCELAGMDGERAGAFKRYVLSGGGKDSAADLQKENIATLAAIPRLQMMDARIYVEVRHDLAHGDDSDTVDVVEGKWGDEKVFKRCTENRGHNGRRIFRNADDKEIKAVLARVCGGAQKKAGQTGQPLIFFYALFCFGAYRKLVVSIENALPLVSPSVVAHANAGTT